MKKIIWTIILVVVVVMGWRAWSRGWLANLAPSNLPQANLSVKLYFVSLDDPRSGEVVGCGDSLVALDRTILETTTPLGDTLNMLLAEKRNIVGGSGLYNALYQSTLRVDKIDLADGVAKIYLVGTYQMGGVCDTPRFKGQLEKTATQFPTVKEAIFYLNGQLLTTSERGE